MDNTMPGGTRLSPIGMLLSFLGASALFSATVQSAGALEFLETRWGFDDRVVVDTFNPLSVVVRNPHPRQFDGAVRLVELDGFRKIGGTYIEPCYVEPGGVRVLQFYPKVSNAHNKWRLFDGEDEVELKPPKDGVPAAVRLVDGGDHFIRSGGIFRHFSHQRFPTTVGATDGLWLVVLDYVPDFSPTQRRGFLDWLKAGGQVHIFRDSSGKHPVFDQDELRRDLDGAGSGANWRRTGYGRVFWHDAQLEGLTDREWQSMRGGSSPKYKEKNNYYQSIDANLFQKLASLTRLRVPWPLIYLAAFVYVLLLGPGHYLWARKKSRDYRVVLLVLLGSFSLFSAIFALIGSRGYGERTTVSSVAVARHIEGNRYDVSSWGNVFVTSGDDYLIKHPATHNLYATGETYDSVNAKMQNGRDGAYEADIPIFSSKPFLHRGAMTGPNPPRLKTASPYTWNWPEDFTPESAWLHSDGKVSRVRIDSDGKVLTDEVAPTEILRHSDYPYTYRVDYAKNEAERRRALASAARTLVARATASSGSKDEESLLPYHEARDSGVIDLYVIAEAPESFQLSADLYDHQVGFVVYRFRYLKPE